MGNCNSLATAIGMMMKRSMYRNLRKVIIDSKSERTTHWKSPRLEAKEYSKVTVVNWINEYRALI